MMTDPSVHADAVFTVDFFGNNSTAASRLSGMSVNETESEWSDGHVYIPMPFNKYYNYHRIILTKPIPQTKQATNDAINSTVNIIGLLAALLVSVVIIVGVAFVIRTIRKRQSTQDESDEESPSQDKSASIVAVEKIVPTQGAPAVDEEGNAEESSSPQVFTISFTEVPMKRQGPLIRLVPKPLRPKPKPVDIEKLKRELGQIYVY